MPKYKYKPNIDNDVEFWDNEIPDPSKRAGIHNLGYVQDYGKYMNLTDGENWDGLLDDNFRDIPFQPNVYEQNIPDEDSIYQHNLKLLNRDMTQYQQPSFDWGTAGKYSLGALGIGGAMYGLYRLINYIRNRNKPNTVVAPTVVQPPVSPQRNKRFRNRNKLKRKV